jgi:hypothetical protein
MADPRPDVDRLRIDAEVSVEIEVERREDLASLADGDLADLFTDQLTNLLKRGEITGDEHAQAWVEKDERGDFDGDGGR